MHAGAAIATRNNAGAAIATRNGAGAAIATWNGAGAAVAICIHLCKLVLGNLDASGMNTWDVGKCLEKDQGLQLRIFQNGHDFG